MDEGKTIKVKIELPVEAIHILNEIAGEWRTERGNLRIGVATVAGEFVMEKLASDPRWKKRLGRRDAPPSSKRSGR